MTLKFLDWLLEYYCIYCFYFKNKYDRQNRDISFQECDGKFNACAI